jgi:hypothetical protein
MWTDAAADPARCPGSGGPDAPAARLADGFPDGRALCPVCLRFVALTEDGRRVEHDTTDAAETATEARSRREWFNTHGW